MRHSPTCQAVASDISDMGPCTCEVAELERIARRVRSAGLSIDDFAKFAQSMQMPPLPAPVEVPNVEHASPTPWTYHNVPGATPGINRDWIEDDHGNVVVNHVGHIDGPLICAAVNAYMAARK